MKKALGIIAIAVLLGMSPFMPQMDCHPLLNKDEIVLEDTESGKKDPWILDKRYELSFLTGDYPISKTMRHVIDANRQEPFNKGENRELMLHIWYPTHRGEIHPLIRYRSDEIAGTKQKMIAMGFPEDEVNNLDVLYTHAPPDDAPWKFRGSFPLILFSHGYLGMSPADYTAFCEELASHGFVVVSVAHTYYATEVVFPDGRKIPAAPKLYTQQGGPSADVQQLWACDVQSALEYLAQCNTNDKDEFYKFFDLDRVGVIGHSLGGATAYTLCQNDTRFKVGVSLDQAPRASDKTPFTLEKPFLFIFADQTIHDAKLSDDELAKKHGVDVTVIKKVRKPWQKNIEPHIIIPGLKHAGFSDLLILKELPVYKNNKHVYNLEAMTGMADGYKTIKYINESMVKFLKRHLGE